MALDIMSALKVVVEKVKEYINDKPLISYGNTQALDATSRTIAKNNVGVYVVSDEPVDALDGDIWIDSDDCEADTNIHVVDANTTDISLIDFSSYKKGDIILVTMSLGENKL